MTALALIVGLASLRYALPRVPHPVLTNFVTRRAALSLPAISAALALLVGAWQFLPKLQRMIDMCENAAGDRLRRPRSGARAAATALTAAVLPASAPQAAGEGAASTLQVTIGNVREATSHVRVAVCTRGSILTQHCPFHGAAAARLGVVVVTVRDVPTGEYAVQAFYDEDDSGQMRKNVLGLPEEGFGFSRDATVTFGSPRFENAAFPVGPSGATILLQLRYLS